MRKVILFIATSLDGYIARKDGAIDWLFTDGDYGYQEFYQSIDTTLTGNATYQQTLTFAEFPYPGKTNYVFTRNPNQASNDQVTFVSSDISDFVHQLKQQNGKDIWLVGGGQINTILLNAGLIDEMIVSIHPIILGDGIALFVGQPREKKMTLVAVKSFDSGLIQLHYQIRD